MTDDGTATAWRYDLALWLAAAVGVTAAFWALGGPLNGVVVGIGMFGLVLAIHLGRRRNDALRTISGVGDERTRGLNQRAMATAGAVLSAVIPAWWFVTVLAGEPDMTVFTLWLVFSFSFLGACVYHSWRG
jgi:hypothetical protein